MYCTAAEVIAYAGITPVPTTDMELLEAFIEAAQKFIDNYCRQTFEVTADTTRYFDADCNVNGRKLMLDAPLAVITTITNGNGVAVASDKYVTEPRNQAPYRAILLKGNAGIAWTYTGTPENAIAITGKWGYSVAAPDDIVQATKQLVAYMWRQKESRGELDRAVLIGNNTILIEGVPKDIYQLLRPYRRLVI